MSLISPIYSRANAAAPVGDEADRRNRAARAALWHRMGIAAINPAEVSDDWLRQGIINEATRQFGRRD